ncbi:MAG: c-type cytochrome biogenesis protein CcmI [Alphaproteobacteria bacterium]|jgi:cytochrome c-type biogenesis protein CcmH|nr:c-type cytochrome biogenesis protein CcmI [Alphaproteobacteria bacterium]
MEQNPWIFWVAVAVLVAFTLAALVAPLIRRLSNGDDSEVSDVDIYKSQLEEVDRDLARGVLNAEEAERTRTEIARRLLAADKAGVRATGEAPRGLNRALAVVTVLGIAGAGVWGYAELGVPGYADQPRSERLLRAEELRQARPTQREAEARITDKIAATAQVGEDVREMIERLRQIVPTRPDDLNGWQLLADNEGRLLNFERAAEAQTRVIALKGAEATETDRYRLAFYRFIADDGAVSPDLQAQIGQVAADRDARTDLWQAMALDARSIGHFQAAARAQERYLAAVGENAVPADFADLLDYLVSAAGGVVTPEAETIAVRLLQRDEGNPAALYYAGLLYYQTERPDRAFNFYRRVIETGTPGTLHYTMAAGQIEDVAWLAGKDYTLPETQTRGPSAADMAAAQDMSEEDRTAMIGGMVSSLSERLANEGGTPDEWAQLIRALGVLGETERAAAIWGEAQEVFASSEQAVDTIRSAARAAGVAE